MKTVSIAHEHFDEIFLVNLKREKEKKLKAYWTLKSNGINPKIWEAVDGYSPDNVTAYNSYNSNDLGNLHFAEFNELEKKHGRKFIGSPGAFGYIKTYIEILNYSLHKGFKKILIFEDDVLLHSSFEQQFHNFILSISHDWKIIQLGASQYNWDSVGSIANCIEQRYYLPRIIHTCGSFAMGIDMSIANELLENLKYMDAPFDHIPIGKIYEKYNSQCFVAFPNIVIADVTRSTIREKREQVSHSLRMKWNLQDYTYQFKPSFRIIFNTLNQIRDIAIGDSLIEKKFDINWLYLVNGSLRPVHSTDSSSLKINATQEAVFDLHSMLSSESNYVSDYSIRLTKNFYTEEELILALEELILKENVADFELLFKTPRDLTFRERNDCVSIIIPTYQRAENLESALESVINQTYKNIEIMVVDDNHAESEDRFQTERILRKYLSDSRIRYITHETNLNGAAARNTGIMHSTGSYIAFLDDDNIYFPNKIEACISTLRSLDQSYGGVYGGFIGWNSNEDNPQRYKSGDLTLDILTLSYQNHYLTTCTALYRKSALLRINGFDDSFARHQDLELNLRFFRNFKIEAVKIPVVKVRPFPTKNNNQLFGEKFFEVKRKYLKRFKSLISSYPEHVQTHIYQTNWNEVKKHFNNESQFYAKCLASDEAGIFSFAVNKTDKTKTPDKAVNINNDYFTNDLLKQNEWYKNTYEALPWWWKKIGSILRRINRLMKRIFT